MRQEDVTGIIQTYLEALSVRIGSRPAGSEAHNEAEAFIMSSLKDSGFTAEVQGYDCPYWVLDSYSFRVGDNQISVLPNTFSPSCDLTAPIINLGSLKELTQKELTGKIAVLHGELSEHQFFPKNFDFFRFETQDHIISLLEEKKPSAVVFALPQNERFIPMIEDSDFNIPSVTVSAQAAQLLLANEGIPAELKIVSQQFQRRSSNIVVRNVERMQERVLLCAHYDTKYGTPGALDNASGVAVLLAVAQLMKASPKTVGVEMVFFGGEDSWYPGDMNYLSRNEDSLPYIKAALNVDGIGFKGSKSSIAFLECPDKLVQAAEEVRKKYPDIIKKDPWYESNHTMFWPRGIPSMALTSHDLSGLSGQMIHTSQDTIELLDLDQIAETALFVKELLPAVFATHL